MSDKPRYLIRDAVPADVATCFALNHDYQTEYVWQLHVHGEGPSWRITIQEDRLPRPMDVQYPKVLQRLQDALEPDNGFLVAVQQTADHDRIVGYLTLFPDNSTGIARLVDVILDTSYREGRLGMKLLNIANRWAMQRNLTRIHAVARTKNHPTITLLQRVGYTFCGYNDRYFDNHDIAVFFDYPLL